MKKTSLAEIVRRKIDRWLFIRDALNAGVLNYSAFSRLIEKEVEAEFGRKVTREAIVLAVRRYEDSLKKEFVSGDILQVMENSTISLKSNMADIAMQRNEDVEKAIFKILKKVEWDRGENLYLILSTSEIEVVLSSKRAKQLLAMIPEKHIVDKIENIATLEISEAHTIETPGFMNFVTGILARNSINVLQFLSSYTEMIFTLEEKDSVKAYELFQGVRQKGKNFKPAQTTSKHGKNPH